MTLLSVAEVAKRLRLSERRVRQLCEDGRLGRRVGGRVWVVSEREVVRFEAIPRRPGRPRASKPAR